MWDWSTFFSYSHWQQLKFYFSHACPARWFAAMIVIVLLILFFVYLIVRIYCTSIFGINFKGWTFMPKTWEGKKGRHFLLFLFFPGSHELYPSYDTVCAILSQHKGKYSSFHWHFMYVFFHERLRWFLTQKWKRIMPDNVHALYLRRWKF